MVSVRRDQVKNGKKVDWYYVRDNLIIAAKQLEDVDFNDPESIRSSALYNYGFNVDVPDTETEGNLSPIDTLKNAYRVYFTDLINVSKQVPLMLYYNGYYYAATSMTRQSYINQFDVLITSAFDTIIDAVNDSDKVESTVKSFINKVETMIKYT